MKTIQKEYKVYEYNELSDKAKNKAHCQYANELNYEWYDHVYEDAKQIASIMGIDIDNIYFSGFSSQGNGACFEGSYVYNKNSVKLLKEYAPSNNELHSIAQTLANIQKRNFYQLTASVKHRGHYYHELCTVVNVERDNWQGQDVSDDDTNDLIDALRDFMRWIYSSLEREYDYITSEESFAEACEANEWLFLENGTIF